MMMNRLNMTIFWDEVAFKKSFSAKNCLIKTKCHGDQSHYLDYIQLLRKSEETNQIGCDSIQQHQYSQFTCIFREV